ncbi:MAG: AraC family transcriptional regulator [Saprospiraceae bacterium]|nr:AraC family transcriptional regulator [Saprospiraceae bacterium]
MDTPLLFEANAAHPVVNRFVEKYQFYRIDHPCYLKTVPNGRMECWKIFSGSFEIWDDSEGSFQAAPVTGGYPATQNSLLFRIKEQLFCLNVKLKLTAILAPAFGKLYPVRLSTNPLDFKEIEDLTDITIPHFFDGNAISTRVLDQWILGLFTSVLRNKELETLIQLLGQSEIQTVAELANGLQMNSKTLHRKTKRYFDLSPKELLSIFRFERTAAYLKSNFANRLTDALQFGYYDQSHFNKESKRITGFSPKQLFERMSLSTHDLMVFEVEPDSVG